MSALTRISLPRRRSRIRPAGEIAHRTIGHTTVVHPEGKVTDEALSLALSMPPDPGNDLVVVDLPVDSPISVWESLAACVPHRRQGVRLVVGGRSREATALAGQWLSQRLRRTVVAPDGTMLRGAAGALFVHSGPNTGWVRFRPAHPPEWESLRFPRPAWDSCVGAGLLATSATAVAEPLPGGVWIRPVGYEERLRGLRARLIGDLPCQPDVLTVVLGCPGTPGIGVDDVLRLCVTLPDAVRKQVRFVHYGPVRVAEDVPVGQALADALADEVVCYAGLPVGGPADPDVYAVRADGTLGWSSFAQQLAYRPRTNGEDRVPTVRAYERPVSGMPELEPAVFWYAPGTVLEVVAAGLWIRPADYLTNARVVRSAPVRGAEHLLVFDGATAAQSDRMRMLAHDVLGRLDGPLRQLSRLVPAAELGSARMRITGRALDTLAEPVGQARSVLEIEAVTEVVPRADARLGAGTVVATGAPTATPVVPRREEKTLTAEMPDAPALPVAVTSRVERAGVLGAPAASPPVTPVVPATPIASSAPAAPAAAPVSMRLESAPAAAPATDRPDDGVVDEGPVTEPPRDDAATIVEPAPTADGTGRTDSAQPQPTPSSAASALLPTRGVNDERSWLRKKLGARYGVLENTIARVLAEHPGFQGAQSSSEALVDAVAVRLYLSEQGADLDAALRSATVGPHVPFARCVVAGLRRLPTHRGATVFRTTPTSAQWRRYRRRKLLTDWGFVNALTTPYGGQDGTADVLVWSITARRTRLLELDEAPVEDRVLFMPGTSFKVLDLTEPEGDRRGTILLRELAASEIDAEGRVDENRVSLDELAVRSLRRAAQRWASEDPRQLVPDSVADRLRALPGLVQEVHQR